jgi:osmotically-inducible protein OsmY
MRAKKFNTLAVIATAIILSCSSVFAAEHVPNENLYIELLDRQDASEADRQLSAELRSTLLADSKIVGVLNIRHYHGKVAISGTVTSVGMIYRVFELAKNVPGVRSVDVTHLDT